MNWSSKDWDRLVMKTAGIALLVITVLCGLFFLAGKASASECEEIVARMYNAVMAADREQADRLNIEAIKCMASDIKHGTKDYNEIMGNK